MGSKHAILRRKLYFLGVDHMPPLMGLTKNPTFKHARISAYVLVALLLVIADFCQIRVIFDAFLSESSDPNSTKSYGDKNIATNICKAQACCSNHFPPNNEDDNDSK